ncbi:AraC family transcriptional regulator [Paracidovorax avenae]
MKVGTGAIEWHRDGELSLSGHHLLPSVRIPAEWARMVRMHDLDEGATIGCWSGRPSVGLDITAEGPAMFCIGVLLEGQASMALDGGPPLHLHSGMAVVQTADRPSAGRFVMQGDMSSRLVDIRFTLDGLRQAGGRPLLALQGQFLQDCSLPAAQTLMGGFPAPASLLRVATDILTCDFSDKTVRSLYLRAKALEALAIVLQTVGPTSPLSTMSRERPRLLQAKRLLDERFEEEWTLDRLAREVGLGEKKLQAGFKAMAGRSVHDHLREVRLSAAAAMLAAGTSVTDTAAAVGFASLSHFSKSFRESRGVLPREWLKARRH